MCLFFTKILRKNESIVKRIQDVKMDVTYFSQQ